MTKPNKRKKINHNGELVMGKKRRKTRENEYAKLDHGVIEVKQEDLLKKIKPCDLNKRYIFISYSSNDWEQVYKDVIELQNRGYEVWLDDKNLDKKEESWEKAALEAIRNVNCRLLIFYVSEHSLTSRNCYNEVMETLSDISKKRHNTKAVPLVCIDVMPIKEINDFGKKIMERIDGTPNMDHSEKNELIETVADFLEKVFHSNNKRVRVPSAKAEKRKVEYYSEIVQTFDGCNLYNPRQVRRDSASGQTKPTPPIPQKAEESESSVFSPDNERSPSGKHEQPKPSKVSKQTILKDFFQRHKKLIACILTLCAIGVVLGIIFAHRHAQPVVGGKNVIVTVDGEIVENGGTHNILSGSMIQIDAFPINSVEEIVVRFSSESEERVYKKESSHTIEVGETKGYGYYDYMEVNVKYSDGLYLDDRKIDETTYNRYTMFVIKKVQNKDLRVTVDGNVISPNSLNYIKAGSKLTLHADPEMEVENIWWYISDDHIELMNNDTTIQISDDWDTGSKLTYRLNALFSDGLYLSDGKEPKVSYRKYLFEIVP